MRILLVAPPWYTIPPRRYGGIEVVVASLADGLVDLGHDVDLVAAPGSTTRARLHPTEDVASDAVLGDPLVELGHALAAHALRQEVDLVHDHTTTGAALGAVGVGPPVVHTLHGEWTPAARRIHRQIADRVHLVAISHDQASRAPTGVPIAGVVHNGIALEGYPFLPWAEDGHLAFLGRAGDGKGADVAVEVAVRTGRPLRMAVKVSEQGERAWWERVMVPLLEEATVPVEIVRNADHQQKLAVLVGARALLCPLRWDEPFGLMMVEAGACGTPVVAWDRGAVSEVVDDGRSGFVVAPGDVDGLCDAVERADEIDRRAARDRVEQHFSAWRMLHDHQRLYRRVLAAHAASRDSASAFTARTEDTVLRIPEAGRAAGRR